MSKRQNTREMAAKSRDADSAGRKQNSIKTMITHDKGATWQPIKAPEYINGKLSQCYIEDGCSLHLSVYSNSEKWMSPPYTQESAVGLILATGNMGDHLNTGPSASASTYLSRDGGITW